MLPYTARSVIGKVLATFVPIYMFFAMGYEHMVVNQFIIPSCDPLRCPPISMYDFWVGNQLPVTIGNFLGGFLFTGAALGCSSTRAPLERKTGGRDDGIAMTIGGGPAWRQRPWSINSAGDQLLRISVTDR